jgi:hypothetical protein
VISRRVSTINTQDSSLWQFYLVVLDGIWQFYLVVLDGIWQFYVMQDHNTRCCLSQACTIGWPSRPHCLWFPIFVAQ